MPQGRFILCLISLVVGGTPAMAGDADAEIIAESDGTTYARVPQSTWETSTRSDETSAETPRPTTAITIRAYDGFDRLQPFHGDLPAYGVNVTAEIETCPNGTQRISRMNIGGWPYQVDGDCSDYRRGSRVEVVQGDSSEQADAVIVCDPGTWRCRTSNNDHDSDQ